MHEFKFKGNQLYCEDVKMQALAGKFGHPLTVAADGVHLYVQVNDLDAGPQAVGKADNFGDLPVIVK